MALYESPERQEMGTNQSIHPISSSHLHLLLGFGGDKSKVQPVCCSHGTCRWLIASLLLLVRVDGTCPLAPEASVAVALSSKWRCVLCCIWIVPSARKFDLICGVR